MGGRPADSAMRLPVSGIYKIKGVGDVVAGRVEQGTVKPGEEVCFLPTHTASNPCGGKVFTVEMHHKGQESGGKKMEDPHSLKSNEMAEVNFAPQQPLVVDTFKNCEGLSRIAFLD